MNSLSRTEHIPVLADDFIRLLCHNPDGFYIDATFGRGGHTRLLLNALSEKGRVLALDRDPQAIATGQQLMCEDRRLRVVHAEFSDLEQVLHDVESPQVDGIGFDLGVSSPQLDQAERGFSFTRSGPLDMRMNPEQGQPLWQRLQRCKERELVTILREYGNERFAGRIARHLMNAIHADDLHTTAELENICFHAVPPKHRHGSTHPATRTFQALRIWLNEEYLQIDAGIQSAMRMLSPGGHLAVISFHSGEDRRVRDLIEDEVHPCQCPPQLPMCVCGRTASMRWLQKKPLRASENELTDNPRSRSALLRAAVRLNKEQS